MIKNVLLVLAFVLCAGGVWYYQSHPEESAVFIDSVQNFSLKNYVESFSQVSTSGAVFASTTGERLTIDMSRRANGTAIVTVSSVELAVPETKLLEAGSDGVVVYSNGKLDLEMWMGSVTLRNEGLVVFVGMPEAAMVKK
jgi:hypothetical protein